MSSAALTVSSLTSNVSMIADAGGLREHLGDAVEAALQVGRADARHQGDGALAAEELDRFLAHDAAASLVVDAVERDPLRVGRVGVPRDDRDARIHGAIDRLGQEIAVQARDGDAVHALRDERLEDFLLLQLVAGLRAAPDDLDVAELFRRALGADLGVVEHRNVERLRDDGEPQLARRLGGRRAAPPQATIVTASEAASAAERIFILSPPSENTKSAELQFRVRGIE